MLAAIANMSETIEKNCSIFFYVLQILFAFCKSPNDKLSSDVIE